MEIENHRAEFISKLESMGAELKDGVHQIFLAGKVSISPEDLERCDSPEKLSDLGRTKLLCLKYTFENALDEMLAKFPE